MSGPPPPPTDNPQERFRAEAGAIVAAERGLTPSCRIKLADLARQIGLDEAQAQEVLRSFGGAPPSQSPAAKKFQRDVRKTLTSLAIAALTPLHESRLLEVARKKHALSDTEAEAIIAATAAELGVGRISSDEACATLDIMIADKLGDDEWLDYDSRETLYKAGERWGLSQEDVDSLVRHRLDQNRQGRKRQQWLQRGAIGGAAALVVVASLLLVTFLGRDRSAIVGPDAPGTPQAGGAPSKTRQRVDMPDWWTTNLALEIAALKREGGELAQAAGAVATEDSNKRPAAYERLVQFAVDSAKDERARRQVANLLGTLHALDPDEASAAEIRNAAFARIPTADAAPNFDPQALSDIREAALLPATLLGSPELTEARRTALLDEIQRSLGVSVTVEAPILEREKPLLAGISQRLYRQLIHAARHDPGEAAKAYPAIDSYARRDLPPADAERLEGEFLAAWLLSAAEEWTTLRDPLVLYVSSCQQANLFRLLDVYQRSTVPTLTEQLGRLLLTRVGAAAPPMEKKVTLAALRQALGVNSGGSSATGTERWQRLAERAEALLAAKQPENDDVRGQLEGVLRAAWLGNLAVMLAQGEANYPQFDKAIEEDEPALPPELMAGSDESSSEPPAGTPSAKSAKRDSPRSSTPSQAEVQRYVELLSKFEQHAPAQRVTAIRGLGILTSAVSDITPERAAPIARYLLAAKSDEEQQQLETAIGALRAWKHLRLAIADGLQGSRLKADQLVRMLGSLLGRSTPDVSDRAALKRMLLQDVLDSLGDVEAPAERGSEGERLAALLDDAATKLTDLYRERLRALGAAGEDFAGTDSPSRTLAKCAQRLQVKRTNNVTMPVADWSQQLIAVDYVAANDLQRTILMQNIWIDASLAHVPRHDSNRLAMTKATSPEAADAIAQLRQRELTSLKIWLLHQAE